jgi:phage shock protein A
MQKKPNNSTQILSQITEELKKHIGEIRTQRESFEKSLREFNQDEKQHGISDLTNQVTSTTNSISESYHSLQKVLEQLESSPTATALEQTLISQMQGSLSKEVAELKETTELVQSLAKMIQPLKGI